MRPSLFSKSIYVYASTCSFCLASNVQYNTVHLLWYVASYINFLFYILSLAIVVFKEASWCAVCSYDR